jgi:hypothetical protein
MSTLHNFLENKVNHSGDENFYQKYVTNCGNMPQETNGMLKSTPLLCIDCINILLIGTLVILMYKFIQIDHPQFRILFHDLLFSMGTAICSLVLTILALLDCWSCYDNNVFTLAFMGLHFHSIVWLVVAKIRYILIRAKVKIES